MANEEQLAIIRQGVDVWNKWREENPDENIDLSKAELGGLDLCGANLHSVRLNQANLIKTNLAKANLLWANLYQANLHSATLNLAMLKKTDFSEAVLRNADLSGAILYEANLYATNLSGANLRGANLSGADLTDANLSLADISKASLVRALIVQTNIQDTVLKDCRIYGISVWDPIGIPADGAGGLIITPTGQPEVTVDDLEVAQFVYLLLNNEKVRNVLDTIGKKGVLILGRFSPERKQVLDALRDKLRTMNFVPMMFDFEGATTKDFTETVKILAGMSRFIIADITSPKAITTELEATVPDYKVPFVPIIQEGEEPFSMFANLQSYPWMFDVLQYKDSDQLIRVIDKAIIKPALIKADELNVQKAEEVRKRHAEDYL